MALEKMPRPHGQRPLFWLLSQKGVLKHKETTQHPGYPLLYITASSSELFYATNNHPNVA
jgi:hypothetical protein